jgi:putative ABC transport system substrate-binding protein
MYRIGFLRAGQPPKTWVEGFRQGLRERGYVDGQNVVIEFGFTDGSLDQLPRLAEELLRSKVDVVVASAAPAALAVKKATTSVPIVFVGVNDPVGLGLVSSLGRPAGNITGLATTSAALAGKRLELLKEVVPKLRRVAILGDPVKSDEPGTAQRRGGGGTSIRRGALSVSSAAWPGSRRRLSPSSRRRGKR